MELMAATIKMSRIAGSNSVFCRIFRRRSSKKAMAINPMGKWTKRGCSLPISTQYQAVMVGSEIGSAHTNPGRNSKNPIRIIFITGNQLSLNL
jgi:hypothetical protein